MCAPSTLSSLCARSLSSWPGPHFHGVRFLSLWCGFDFEIARATLSAHAPGAFEISLSLHFGPLRSLLFLRGAHFNNQGNLVPRSYPENSRDLVVSEILSKDLSRNSCMDFS